MSDASTPTIRRTVCPSAHDSHNVYYRDSWCLLRLFELWCRSVEWLIQNHPDSQWPWHDHFWFAPHLHNEKEYERSTLAIMAFDAISEILLVNIADPILRQDRVAFPWRKNCFWWRNIAPNRSCFHSQAVPIANHHGNFRIKCSYKRY